MILIWFIKLKKFFDKAPRFIIIVINILFVSFLYFNNKPAFSKVTNFEVDLALNYCDSIEKNLFKGLDNEKILKYKYFFNSINEEALDEENKNLSNFALKVENICSHKLSNEEIEDIKKELKIYLNNN